jgi:alkyl sulfatase BDS1-like metallo-beta-lactamase superfamily hydrolase
MAREHVGERKDATTATRAANATVLGALPFDDRRAFEAAQRGFIATLDPPLIRTAAGRVVWNLEPYRFVDGAPPDTVNPSLWRQAQLHRQHGLFKVVDRLYQVRGFDVSNMSIVEGDSGYIVIDPLNSAECAAAGMELVRHHLGGKPIRAVIYTHSHTDHFGGVKGIIAEEDVRRGDVQVIAPVGFMEHAISENIYAGTPMNRRATYMFGGTLPIDPRGHVSVGIAIGGALGTVTLIPPTDLIGRTGEERTLDGVRLVFQYTPETEAPAEMHFYFPQLRALCMAENCNQTMHNLYTPRGAQIRDARAWSSYINEALDLFGDDSDVLFISHTWPVWGGENVREFLRMQRDLYKYLHDETLRLASHGYTMVEIAERVALPERLAAFWANRGYYGTLNHNVKAVYQRYLGWYDGNPAHLNPHEPVEAARRYVAFMGGAEAVLERARASFAEGDYRWVAEVVNHVVFAEPENREARALEADALEQLGYQAESGPWRDFYLTGAQELRGGVPRSRRRGAVNPGIVAAMTGEMLLDYLAIRLNGPRAAGRSMTANLVLSDTDEVFRLTLGNGVLVYSKDRQVADADVTVTLSRPTLAALVMDETSLDAAIMAGDAEIQGDRARFEEFLALCDQFEFWFGIVTPNPAGS